jgi:V/A-type H+-transporting ATPase subunit E
MEISESSEAIRRKILDDAEKEAQRIIEKARINAAEIINASEERAKEIRETEIEERKKRIEETSIRRIAETKVDHHRRIQTLKSGLIDDVFNKIIEYLRRYVEKPSYQETLNSLIIEGGSTLGGGKLVIRLNGTDKKKVSQKTLKQLSQEIEKITQIETKIVLDENPVETIGGVVVSTADQKAIIDNTFEVRLERVKEEAQTELETLLFK